VQEPAEPDAPDSLDDPAFLRAVLEHATDLVVVVDERGALRYMTPAARGMLGFGSADALGTSALDHVHPDDRDALVASMAGSLAEPAGSGPPPCFRFRYADGSYRHLELVTSNLLDDPTVRGLVISIRDVSERVETEEALRASEQRYRLVFEGSRDAVIVVDRDTLQIVDGNAAAEAMYGWSFDELVGLPVATITTNPEMAAQSIRAVGEETIVVRRRHRRKDGSELDVEIAFGSVMLDGSLKVVAVVRDVTERLLIEQRFQTLVEHSSDIIFVLDATGTLTYASPSVTRLLGYPSEDVIGRPATDFVIPEDQEAVITEIARVLPIPGAHGGLTYRAIHADGSLRVYEAIGQNRLDDPAVRGLIVNARDVTERVEAEAALQDSEDRFRALVQHATDLVTVSSADGSLIYVSPSAEKVLGFTPDELKDTIARELMHPEDLERVSTIMMEALADGVDPPPLEYRARHRDGTWRVLEGISTNLLDEPSIQGLVTNARDVTERRTAERRAAELTDILEASNEVVVVSDPGGRVLYANNAARNLLGTSEGQHVGELSSPASRERLRSEIMPAVRQRGVWTGELEMVARGGTVPIAATVQAYPDETGHIARIATIAHDISELKAAQQRLEYEATHDLLTSLPNRAMFREIGERALARAARTGEPIGVLFLDLDGFKLVNDSFGHDVGDRLLAQVARRLREAVRLGDTVARLGGDEFVILCEQPQSEERMVELSNRLIEVVSEPLRLQDDPVVVGASVGIAYGAGDGAGIGEMIREADIALYQAKRKGRGRAELFDGSMI